MRRLPAVVCVAAVAFASSVVAAGAQQGRTQVGVLECRSGPTVGMVVGSRGKAVLWAPLAAWLDRHDAEPPTRRRG